MKEKILKALQTKYNGVDEKTLDRIATKLAKTINDEADIQTAVDGVTIQQLMESYGDARATDATTAAVTNYEKKHGLKNGKPVEKPAEPEPKPKEEEIPAYLKPFLEKQKALEDKLAQYVAKEVGDSRLSKLNELLKDAPANVQKMYKDNFSAMSFKDDEAFTSWLDTNKPIIEGLTKDFAAAGAGVHPPKGGTGNKAGEVSAAAKAAIDARAKEAQATAVPAIMGMPVAPK